MTHNSELVAVLMGGWTSEAAVSRVSASFCAQAARNAGWDATEIEVDRNIAVKLRELSPARVFNALHGQIGEDGNIQGLLNIMNIPYTHSGLNASAIAMDKEISKKIFLKKKILTPKYFCYSYDLSYKDLLFKIKKKLNFPVVIKPIDEGSSVNVFICNKKDILKNLKKLKN